MEHFSYNSFLINLEFTVTHTCLNILKHNEINYQNTSQYYAVTKSLDTVQGIDFRTVIIPVPTWLYEKKHQTLSMAGDREG